jgi:four helix bundle protein
MSKANNKYDLEERTAKLGESVIMFCRTLEQNVITKPLINQLIRSSTSIGANYMEANGASSKRDFKNKIYICKKESQETKHWLRMLKSCFPDRVLNINDIWEETQELTLIFQKIISTMNKSKNKNFTEN